jgi:hypothetical protein
MKERFLAAILVDRGKVPGQVADAGHGFCILLADDLRATDTT